VLLAPEKFRYEVSKRGVMVGLVTRLRKIGYGFHFGLTKNLTFYGEFKSLILF